MSDEYKFFTDRLKQRVIETQGALVTPIMNRIEKLGDYCKPGGVVKQSEERLLHFQCAYCDKRWSVGDAPKQNIWYCPWCGLSQRGDE